MAIKGGEEIGDGDVYGTIHQRRGRTLFEQSINHRFGNGLGHSKANSGRLIAGNTEYRKGGLSLFGPGFPVVGVRNDAFCAFVFAFGCHVRFERGKLERGKGLAASQTSQC